MPYNKQIFVDGEVLTAEQLNHMEQGIFDAMKQAEQGGGGGSVDIDEIVDAVIDALPVYNGEVEDV
jgi:hypothetical protein